MYAVRGFQINWIRVNMILKLESTQGRHTGNLYLITNKTVLQLVDIPTVLQLVDIPTVLQLVDIPHRNF